MYHDLVLRTKDGIKQLIFELETKMRYCAMSRRYYAIIRSRDQSLAHVRYVIDLTVVWHKFEHVTQTLQTMSNSRMVFRCNYVIILYNPLNSYKKCIKSLTIEYHGGWIVPNLSEFYSLLLILNFELETVNNILRNKWEVLCNNQITWH